MMAPRAWTTGRTSTGLRLACLLTLLMAAAGASPFRPVPKFEGKAIPDPPRQREPWALPATKLPRFLVTATAALFEQGVADPRGCEYREVEVGDGFVLKSHGFVLPATPGESQRFAVGWDGVVYPALSVGAAADLDADVRGLVDALKKGREDTASKGAARHGSAAGLTGLSGPRFASGSTPTGPASVETPAALKLCMLLRLGRADLAEALFAAGTAWTPDAPRPDLTSYGISYLTSARDWASRVYNRAVDAHGRGDDGVALDAARRVAAFSKSAEARLDAMGFPRPQPAGAGAGAGVSPYFSDLRQLRDLVADQERRASEPPRGPVPGPDATPEARVAVLIRDLDQVTGMGIIHNGIVSPNGSDIERSLVRVGDAAVGPLLAVLESDNRLTRTVSYPGSRHGADDRSISYVYQPAHSALTGILNTRVIPGATGVPWGNDPAARRREAAAVRAYWEKVRGVPELERYYRTLADDDATPAQWLDAAEAVAQPADVRGRGGSYMTPYRVGGKVPPPRGEPLRDRQDPGVTALIARRADSIDPGGSRQIPTQGSGDVFRVRDANRMAGFLAEWDPKGALPTLAARVARTAAIVKASEGGVTRQDGLEADIARLTLLRIKGDDPRALDDYAAWVRTLTPSGFGFFPVEAFEPMWRNPDHPAVAAAAESLFGDPKSPWVPLFRPRERGWGGDALKAGLISSPLLGVSPFRTLVLAGLADRKETGSVVTDASGKIAVRLDEGTTTFPDPPKDDPLRPGPSSMMPLRLADLYCWTLRGLGGTPRIELYWPEARRDAAVAECAAMLRQYGPRYRYNPVAKSLYESAPFYPRYAKAVLAFDRLDRPATPDDVRAGRAVFRLEGAEVRTWPMPAYPMKGRWTTLVIPPDDPVLRMNPPPKGVVTAQVESLQGGTVWQAEEAREGGRWRRYYGFVGPYDLARVPAEEMEFPAGWNTGWWPSAAGVDVRVIPPGGEDDGTRVVTKAVPPDGPLPFEVWVRNRRGVEATVAGDRGGTDGGTWLREGVAVRLTRDSEGLVTMPAPTRPRVVEEVTSRPVRRVPDGGPLRALAPAEAFRALRLDLRDLFTIDRPGRYRLEVGFDDLKRADGTPAVVSAEFTLSGPTGEGPTGGDR